MSEGERRLRDNLQATEHRVQRAVSPIYGLDNRDRPQLIGSAVLLSVTPHIFLITAAHVLDENKDTTLYLAGRHEPIEVAGPSYRVLAPPSGRRDDNLDVGFILLAGAMVNELARFTVLTPQDIDVDDLPAHHTLYGFVGYPGTRNKPLPGRKFQLSSAVFVLTPTPLDRYAPLGLNPLLHFVADFDRNKLVDRQKGLITGPQPHGLSGGGVWRLGRHDEFLAGSHTEKLIGIGIEYRESTKVLVGVRMSLVVASLAKCYPDIAAQLPQPTRIGVNVAIRQAL